MSCDCKCSVALPQDAMGESALCVIFPEHTHYFKNIKQVSYIYDDI